MGVVRDICALHRAGANALRAEHLIRRPRDLLWERIHSRLAGRVNTSLSSEQFFANEFAPTGGAASCRESCIKSRPHTTPVAAGRAALRLPAVAYGRSLPPASRTATGSEFAVDVAVAVAVDLDLDLRTQWSRHHKSRLGCRLNAGVAQWAERHGCRESRIGPWMAHLRRAHGASPE